MRLFTRVLECGLDRMSAIIRGTKRYLEYAPSRFSTRSLPECNYECFVAICAACLRSRFVVEFCAEIHNSSETKSQRDADIEDVTRNYTSSVCNREFMIISATLLNFSESTSRARLYDMLKLQL